MAEVHLARETTGEQRLVALKQMLPHLSEDPEFQTMFLDEARIAARLHHPNVVEVYDLGRHGDALFIAMEYVHGEDLRLSLIHISPTGTTATGPQAAVSDDAAQHRLKSSFRTRAPYRCGSA